MGAWALSLTGIVIVFLGLGILYLVMVIQTKVFYKAKESKSAPVIKRSKQSIVSRSEPETKTDGLSHELEYAAAVAAVIAYMENLGVRKESIRIRSVKRLKQRKNEWKVKDAMVYWNKWGKEKKSRGVKQRW